MLFVVLGEKISLTCLLRDEDAVHISSNLMRSKKQLDIKGKERLVLTIWIANNRIQFQKDPKAGFDLIKISMIRHTANFYF